MSAERMLQFGIHTYDQLQKLGPNRRMMGVRVSYGLLDVGDTPSPELVKQFEDICFALRLSNGTFRTSFRNRFADLNTRMASLLAASFSRDAELRIEDRAVSHALTACEWAKEILAQFPRATFQASDLLLHLVKLHLPDGSEFVAEPDGTLLQAIAPPFVVSLCHREPRRYPVNQLIARRQRRRFEALDLPGNWPESDLGSELHVRKIPLIHPEARALAREEPRFEVVRRSVFECIPQSCEVLRTMNILNRSYFSEAELNKAVRAVLETVVPGGWWVVGRTTEDAFENHVSIFRRADTSWELVERLRSGSEIESLALSAAW